MTAAAVQPDRAQQLWLDVARPIQPRPVRGRPAPARPPQPGEPAPQMELRMAVAPRKPAAPERNADTIAEARTLPACAAPIEGPRPCFATWLLGQSKSGGAIGELAKAARVDRLFPRAGDADIVRLRFDKVGADGDAYAALDDAERAYDRLA